jgi:hypothetical protein
MIAGSNKLDGKHLLTIIWFEKRFDSAGVDKGQTVLSSTLAQLVTKRGGPKRRPT